MVKTANYRKYGMSVAPGRSRLRNGRHGYQIRDHFFKIPMVQKNVTFPPGINRQQWQTKKSCTVKRNAPRTLIIDTDAWQTVDNELKTMNI